MSSSQKSGSFEKLYDLVTQGGTPDYVSKAYDEVLEGSIEPGIAAQTGPIGDHILTGTCLQTPEASAAIEEGVNPIKGEEMADYSDVAGYLDDLPDSLAVFANQFGHTDLEQGTVYILKEDSEWPQKLSETLEQAGIEHDENQLQSDVDDAYNQVLSSFETYVTEVLNNDVETTVISTSEIKEEMENYIAEFKDEHNISQDKGVYEQICLLTTPFGAELIEDHLGLSTGTLDIVDPASHHPYLFNLESDAKNIFAEQALKYYQEQEKPKSNVALTYPAISTWANGFDKEPIASNPVNSDSIGDVEQKIKDVDVSHPSESALMKASSAFPNHIGLIKNIVAAQSYIDQHKDKMEQEAEKEIVDEAGVAHKEEIFQNPEEFDLEVWGAKLGKKVKKQKQETGIVEYKSELAEKISEDLKKLFEV